MNERVPGRDAAPPGAQVISFRVNGELRRVTAPPVSRLADVLRDDLGLTGTKIGCNAGDCGACTVRLDGRQVCACLVALGQVGGRAVTTVEGLAAGGRLDRLQRAFVAHGAAQCGICTPGMLMAAADLLERNPRPTEAEALDALGGVLCRCTGYRKIVEAVLAAASGEAARAEAPIGRRGGSPRAEDGRRGEGPGHRASTRPIVAPPAHSGCERSARRTPKRASLSATLRRCVPGTPAWSTSSRQTMSRSTASASSPTSRTSRCSPPDGCAFAAKRCCA